MFTIHGHRGCRGYLPENTIPAFLKAIDMGCHFLEMDVVVTKDKEVLISHEPWLNHEICLAPDGQILSPENEKSYNLYDMTYAQIKQIDCGSIGHPRFPTQQPMRTYKPSLRDMIDAMEWYTQHNGLLPISYNIEVKRLPEGDGKFHPNGLEFSTLIIDILKEKKVLQRSQFQSFDIECMLIAHQLAPELRLSFLVDNDKTIAENIQDLGFMPPVYGPSFQKNNADMMFYAQAHNLEIIPWTVNEKTDIHRQIQMGVSGLISDYPDRVTEVVAELRKEAF